MTRTARESIEELCRLRHLVSERIFRGQEAADCCCGRGGWQWEMGGVWPDEPRWDYLDSGRVNDFIRAAVLEKIVDTQTRRRRRTVIVRPLPEPKTSKETK